MNRTLEQKSSAQPSGACDEVVVLDDLQLALAAGGVGEVIFPN